MSRVGLFLLTLLLTGSLVFLGACATDDDDTKLTEEEKAAEEEAHRFDFLRKNETDIKPSVKETLDMEKVVPDESATEAVLNPEQIQKLETAVQPSAATKFAASAQPQTGKNSAEVKKSAPYYEDFILLDADEKLAVSLVFNSAPLLDVIPAFADALGFNFLADPDLKGTVTLNLNSNLSKRDLWETFDKMLTLSGATVRVEGSLLRIFPISKLAQQPDLTLSKSLGEVCYFPLKNTTAKDIVAQVKPFLSKDASIVELTRPNAILLSDSRGNVEKARQILDMLDRSGKTEWPRAVITCRNILPSKITAELKTILPVLGFYVLQTNETTRTEQPGSIQLSALDRLQIIIVSAATEEAIQEIRNWVGILDSALSMDQESVFVYKVMHGKADELLQVLSTVFNLTGQTRTVDVDTGNDRTQSVNSQNMNNNNRRTTTNTNAANQTRANANLNNVSNTETDLSSNIFENQVRAYADGVLNRLVIRTTPRTYAAVKALLDRIDIVPAQVLLQVLVVEVTLDKTTQYGLELAASGTVGGQDFSTGTNFSDMNPFVTDASTGEIAVNGSEQGGKFLIFNPDNPQQKFGYIKALAKDNNIKVISSPQLLVSSHKEAQIWVGQKVPYTQSALTSTSSVSQESANYLTSITFEETGTRLTITPQVTSTDYISLEVLQELSDVDTNTYTKVDAPVFTSRTVKTTMTIQNGRTMVIGGLIREVKTDDLQSLPIIDNIPLLRRLFGSTDAQAQRSEILLLITGTIVSEKSEIESLIKRYNDALKALNKYDNRLGDRPGKDQPLHIFGREDVRD